MAKFDFGHWFKAALGNKNLQDAGIAVIRGIGKQVLDQANSPEALRQLGSSLLDQAPAVLGAIVKDTPAEEQVDASVIAAAESHAGAMQG